MGGSRKARKVNEIRRRRRLCISKASVEQWLEPTKDCDNLPWNTRNYTHQKNWSTHFIRTRTAVLCLALDGLFLFLSWHAHSQRNEAPFILSVSFSVHKHIHTRRLTDGAPFTLSPHLPTQKERSWLDFLSLRLCTHPDIVKQHFPSTTSRLLRI